MCAIARCSGATYALVNGSVLSAMECHRSTRFLSIPSMAKSQNVHDSVVNHYVLFEKGDITVVIAVAHQQRLVIIAGQTLKHRSLHCVTFELPSFAGGWCTLAQTINAFIAYHITDGCS